jgi:osmotically-inducible protein OsmY
MVAHVLPTTAGDVVHEDWYPGSFGSDGELSRDDRLALAVSDALFDDEAVTGGHIDIRVQNAVVILDGRTDTEDARVAAVARAWSVIGVADVCDALSVHRRRRRHH